MVFRNIFHLQSIKMLLVKDFHACEPSVWVPCTLILPLNKKIILAGRTTRELASFWSHKMFKSLPT